MADGREAPAHASGVGGEARSPLSLEELLEILRSAGLATPEQAREIAGRATTLRSRVLKERVGSVRSQAAARYDATPAEIVAAAELQNAKNPRRKLDEDAVAEAIAEAAGVPYLKLDPLRIDGDLIAKTMSRPFARRHAVIAVAQGERGQLRIALTDPFDSALRDSLENLVQRPVEYIVSSKRDILQIIDRVYGFRSSVRGATEHLGDGPRGPGLVSLVQLRSGEELANATANDQHVIAAVEHLLNYAFEQRASDIHLEPRDSAGLVRFRIDGILHDIEKVPLSVHGAITSRVKVLARMDIAERRRPQDGRIKTMRGEREVELRVSSIATAFGEKIVVRVFDPTVLMTDLQQLGFGVRDREIFERWITSPSGLLLVSGPTGSGKTTTLYSTLRYLAGPEVNIQTVEDPIEVVDPRFSQMQVQRQIDVTFATALRSILRQDPDIIMVGEIRDGETAQMAVQAALTGHLVLSTVHTRDAAGAVTRLAELGVERFLLSSVLRGVVAQRLVRCICPHCIVEGFLTPTQVTALGLKVPTERREQLRVRFGEGCVECRYTGLYGRIGVFEMLDVGRRVRQLVNEGRDSNEIAHAARVEGMETLREAAIRKLAEGATTFEEVVRVTRGRAVSREQVDELGLLVRAGWRAVALETFEEERALRVLGKAASATKRALRTWSCSAGLGPDGAGAGSLDACVEALATVEEPAIFALLDAQRVLAEGAGLRRLRDRLGELGKRKQMVVFVGPVLELPVELEREVGRVRLPLPAADELRGLFEKVVEGAGRESAGADVLDACVRAALGLTAGEAARAFRKAWLEVGRLGEALAARIVREKRQALHRTPALTFHEASEGLAEVGGLGELKAWLRERRQAFGDDARRFGLPAPRGLLLLGVQGCGKSLCAKAVAREWQFPLLRVDLAAAFGDPTRTPELAMREAIAVAESLAPAVLWIDEIEKGFAVAGADGSATRTFGSFLTWMAEKRAPVFVVATANDVTKLPPELLRRGRFDDLFFVDLPGPSERVEILSIHLAKNGRDPVQYPLEELAAQSERLSGAELEQVVAAGLYKAFAAGRELADRDLADAITETVPLYETYEERIKELRNWARHRARPASSDGRMVDLFEAS